MIRVLFVCLGNICRSPMAEAVMRKLVQEAGLESKITVDSVGTGGWHEGNPPHEGTLNILNRYGISSEGIVARQINVEDLTTSEYIIVMDETNLNDVKALGELGQGTHLGKLCDFIDNTNYEDVPDPYYTGDFDETYELTIAGARGLLAHIKSRGL